MEFENIFNEILFFFFFLFFVTIPLSPSVPLIAMAVLLILCLVKLAVWKQPVLSSYPFLLPILLFIGLSIVSYFLSKDENSWKTILPRELIVYYLFLCSITTLYRGKLLLNMLIVSTELASFIGIAQNFRLFGLSNVSKDGRIHGIVDTNTLAGILAIVLPVILSYAIFSKNIKTKIIYFLCSIPVILALIFTYTRGAWLGAIVGIIAIVGIGNLKLLPIILLLMSFIFLSQPIIRTRLVSGFHFKGNEERVILFKNSIELLKHNILFGIGPGAFNKIYYETMVPPDKRPVVGHRHCHNNFLNIALERGILALAVFIWLLVSTFFHIFKTYKLVDSNEKLLLLGCLGGIVVFVVHGMVDYTFADETGYLYFLLIGISVLIHEKFVESHPEYIDEQR